MSRALVLNASFEPLCIVSTRRALLLHIDGKAEIIHATDNVFHSERMAFPEPSVVRLAYYVKVPYRARVALNRRAVFLRDGQTCQYCGSPAENIDHVIPRSRGGPHAWDNVVAACRPCNSRKEDRLPTEIGMRLRRQPEQPKNRAWALLAIGGTHPHWAPYLGLAQPA